MASDFRMLQHEAAMAVHSLTGAVEQLGELQRRHPELVAAERQDIEKAFDEILYVLAMTRKFADKRVA